MSTAIIIILLVLYMAMGYLGYKDHKKQFNREWTATKIAHAGVMISLYVIAGFEVAVLIYLIATL